MVDIRGLTSEYAFDAARDRFEIGSECSDRVIAARDARGFRPLSVGRLPEGGFMVASETGALKTVGCTKIREVKPGEIVSLQGQIGRAHV